jgi:hypothetical protein
MATDTEPESTPLDTSLQKFLAGSKKPTDTGVRYDPGAPAAAAPTQVAAFRPAVSDVINLSRPPGSITPRLRNGRMNQPWRNWRWKRKSSVC